MKKTLYIVLALLALLSAGIVFAQGVTTEPGKDAVPAKPRLMRIHRAKAMFQAKPGSYRVAHTRDGQARVMRAECPQCKAKLFAMKQQGRLQLCTREQAAKMRVMQKRMALQRAGTERGGGCTPGGQDAQQPSCGCRTHGTPPAE